MKITSPLRLGSAVAVLLFAANMSLRSQVLVESIAAIVGNEVIYLSDLESTVAELRRSGNRSSIENLRCDVFREMLVSKLFLDQARIDSIIVADSDVEGELNMRMNEAIKQAKGEEALEQYFGKSMIEIRRDIRRSMVEQATVREVQSKIAEDITITPAALKRYYASLPKDSLPVIPARYEMSIIQVDPPQNEDNKAEARQKLLDIRSQILAGKSFNVLAVLNSEDEGSAKNGGEIGFMARDELEKEYSEAAFSLTKGTVSKIVETRYGFHIIQLIEKKGEMVNTRHILIRPKVKPQQAQLAITKLDSLANLIRKDSIKFRDAALRYSTHKDSRINGGKLVSPNPSDRTSWFTLEELSPEMYVKVRDLKVGEISEPFRTTDEDNNPVFRIVRLDNELAAHKANLKDDYQALYNAALIEERTKKFDKWVREKLTVTYVRISEELKSCGFLQDGWLNE
ncbi:MAG: peptidylprolyl isomerase [Bacteroidales bacterium]|jgi:peptidyl-prolyl cis-trans isomerase SurA|nr:peptidylprolyl isomerase [Bacteroidales bacterium]